MQEARDPVTGVACYGEVLLRLTAPRRGELLQEPALEVNVGGAEANVAVSLTHFGHPASLVTVLPDNPLSLLMPVKLGCEISESPLTCSPTCPRL